ncbi:MAG: hypothetical protein LUD27_08715 [Clostridia bacterium]|nr:hypothetical protein [Clostridia bacterium]
MRFSSKIAIILACIIATLSIGTVAATWSYSDTTTKDNAELEVELADFTWEQSALILAIVAEMNDTSSNIYSNLNSRFYGNSNGRYSHSFYGSMDNTYTTISSTVSSLLGDSSFIVRSPEDNYYANRNTYTLAYIYTTDICLGEEGNPTIPPGEYIYRVYRTTITRENNSGVMSDWTISTIELGYAPLCFYLEQDSSSIGNRIPSIDMVNWQAGDLGYSQDTAVYTFDGDDPLAYNDLYDDEFDLEKTRYNTNKGGYFYYVLETGSTTYYTNSGSGGWSYSSSISFSTLYGTTYSWNTTGTYNITCDLDSAVIIMYTSDESSPIATGSGSVSFTASSQTKYYIRIDSGGQTVQLGISKS